MAAEPAPGRSGRAGSRSTYMCVKHLDKAQQLPSPLRSARGASVVEMAILSLLLILVIGLATDLGRYLVARVRLISVVAQAARLAASTPNLQAQDPRIRQFVGIKLSYPNLNVGNQPPVVSGNPATAAIASSPTDAKPCNSEVTVVVSFPLDFYFGWLLGIAQRELRDSVTMRYAYQPMCIG